MAADVTQLLKTYQQLKSQRSPWESDWRDCAAFIMPRAGGAIGRRPTPGEKLTTRLYDSTAIKANKDLGASLQGNLTSPAVRWFRYQMRNEDLNREQTVKEWLGICGSRVYAALQQSNFNAENFQGYLDLGAFGTAAKLMVERDDLPGPGFQGFLFRTLSIGTYVVSEDADGRVDTLMYTFQLSADAIRRRWGADVVGVRLNELATAKPTELVDLIHTVVPRAGGGYGKPKTQKPWASCYLVERDKLILEESGYDTFPFMVPRWTKASGEVYGRGPGHDALPDIKTLNKMTELELRAIAKAIDPPMQAADHGVIGTIRVTPGAVTIVREPGKSLVPFESGSNFQVGQIKSANLQAAIKDMFYNNQLQLPTNQPMTATEIERRFELMNRVLGPTVGRLEFEDSNLVGTRGFMLMFKAGALPPPPPIVLEAGEAGEDHLDIVSEGPLSRAQKGSDLLAIERSLQVILPMVQVDPGVLDVMKLDEAARVVMEASNVPAKVFASQQEIDETRQQRAKKQQEEEQLQKVERLAAGAKNVAPILAAVKPAAGAQGAAPPQQAVAA